MNAYHELDGVPVRLLAGAADRAAARRARLRRSGGRRLLHGRHAARLPPRRRRQGRRRPAAPSRPGSTSSCRRSTASALRSPRRSQRGVVPVGLVDRAVRRPVRLKLQLGLFERPYVDAEAAPLVFDTAPQRALARELARKSIVLLKNDGGLLPLRKRSPARRRDRAFGRLASACCRATTTTRRIWRSSSAPSTSMRPRLRAAPAQA